MEVELIPIEDRVTVERIVSASIAVIARHGRFVRALGAEGNVLQVDAHHLSIRYITPFARMKRTPARYGIDIWQGGRGKVFAAWWDRSEPFRVATFVRGPWMNALVPGSFVLRRGALHEGDMR